MTWYTHRNYGTALQACATNQLVKQWGYSPSFIQYTPIGGAYEYDQRHFVKRCLVKARSLQEYKSEKRELLFKIFLNSKIQQTEKCSSYAELHDLNTQFDAFLCGSDQIWTPLNHDDKYFLSFVEQPDKMVAYAPSIGVNKIEDPRIRARMERLINRFQYLSVREQRGAELIQELTGKTAQVVLDPTLLLDRKDWDETADVHASEVIPGKYIICYFLGNAGKYLHYVRTLSAKMGIPYYLIPVTCRQKKDDHAAPFEVGPREFVSLIRNAQYVCTDSFHGIAFAANYNVPFTAFRRFKDQSSGSQNSRIFNLLDILHLQNRLSDHKHFRISSESIACDFTEANALLDARRKESLDYLEQALTAATNAKTEKKKEMTITQTCCGCGACAAICPHQAITVCKNGDGFEHYTIDRTRCVNCGLCQRVCPMTDIIAPDMQDAKTLYAMKSNSVETLRKSSSGGFGHELATLYLGEDYAVCGCSYDSAVNAAKHIWIMPGEENKLHLLQGSKYIQSVSTDAMREIVPIGKEHKILFFGTPCQAAAVDKILRRNGLREQALIVDLICHGVPSYHLWRKYLQDMDRKYHIGDHPEVSFRDEALHWQRRIIRLSGTAHEYRKMERRDDFYAVFRRGLCDMESCFDCPYRKRSAADIRIGDYWGTRFARESYGVSMVIANTDNGEQAIQHLRNNRSCRLEQYDLNEYWTIQDTNNPPKVLIRDAFLRQLQDPTSDLHQLRKKYCVCYDWEDIIVGMYLKLKSFL